MTRLMRALGKRNVASVLIEGGATVAAAALAARVVDRLLIFYAPKLIGGDGRPMLGPLGVRRLPQAPRARTVAGAATCGRRATCYRSVERPMTTDPIDKALQEIRDGRMIILADGAHGEAQLCMAAELVTPDAINFMATHARGLVCLSLTRERMHQLGIPLMVPDAVGSRQPFGASIEARRGVTTGISAGDRATTIRAAMADDAGPDDVVMPGHIFPILGARRRRAGARRAHRGVGRSRASRRPASRRRAVCTILDDDGALAERADLRGTGRAVRAARSSTSPTSSPTACARNRWCIASPTRRSPPASAASSAPSSIATTSISTSTSRW